MAVKVHNADVKCETKHMTDFADFQPAARGKRQLKGKRDTIIPNFKKQAQKLVQVDALETLCNTL